MGVPARSVFVTDSRHGLALLAAEVVVLALALVLVASEPRVALHGVLDTPIAPTVLGGAFVAVGVALGALRTATLTGPRAAVGELGIGVALAVAIALGASALVLAAAVGIAAASASLRIDSDHLHAVTDS